MIARFEEFTLDTDRRVLLRAGVEVHVTPKAFDLLWLLLDASPRVISKSELHDRLWPNISVVDATLVGLVKELRRALDDRDPGSPLLRTVHRVGYAFARRVERVDTAARRAAMLRWVIVMDRRVGLVAGENLIGRHPTAIVHVDAAGVSRRHARIVVDEHAARLEDLGSKNGTLVRDSRVEAPVALHNGEHIQVGPVRIQYRESRDGPSTETMTRQG